MSAGKSDVSMRGEVSVGYEVVNGVEGVCLGEERDSELCFRMACLLQIFNFSRLIHGYS